MQYVLMNRVVDARVDFGIQFAGASSELAKHLRTVGLGWVKSAHKRRETARPAKSSSLCHLLFLMSFLVSEKASRMSSASSWNWPYMLISKSA